ncbi:MAG: GNAT family N-acetyltransferase [Treponema sp.]|jgi:ribosomal protein S18 acetylase RimI-like enzyme|nr:GNAT family N-acetyltransferase [Treponema sp.]
MKDDKMAAPPTAGEQPKEESICIRYAETTDYPWLKEHDQHLTAEILRGKIKNKEIYLVQKVNFSVTNQQTLGYLRYNLFWDEIPFMNKIYLLEAYRNRGIGQRLIDYWENSMKLKGHKTVLTSTLSNEGAQHFYRKMGYTEIGGFKYLDEAFEIIFFKAID